MEDYRINGFGVCVNPKIAAEWSDGCCRYTVEVAFVAGAWRTGYDVSLPKCGVGCPCSAAGDGFRSEREAAGAGLEAVMEFVRERQGSRVPALGKPETESLRRTVADIADRIAGACQPTLFDM